MSLPPELLAPPPRNPAAAAPFLKKTKKTAFGMIFGAMALCPLIAAVFWLKTGDFNQTTILISVGISSLVELMGVALLMNASRSLQLFREGLAAVGKIRKVTAPADNTFVFEVEYLGGNGTMKVGTVTMIGAQQLDTRVGAEVAVLHSLTDARRFAVYTPGLGMVTGVVAR
jgi:hypothetical protein